MDITFIHFNNSGTSIMLKHSIGCCGLVVELSYDLEVVSLSFAMSSYVKLNTLQ
jgi:hypothetical protein